MLSGRAPLCASQVGAISIYEGEKPALSPGLIAGWKGAPRCPRTSAPPACLVAPQGSARAYGPSAHPEQLGSSRRPQQLASGRTKVDLPLSNRQASRRRRRPSSAPSTPPRSPAPAPAPSAASPGRTLFPTPRCWPTPPWPARSRGAHRHRLLLLRAPACGRSLAPPSAVRDVYYIDQDGRVYCTKLVVSCSFLPHASKPKRRRTQGQSAQSNEERSV